mmetsp:Transcript_32342/g.89379  ORF Transcript_32342/g.89379 Transcript_32342/m.89379 type:complete len:448 (-) Transcript_32342:187-1530(-)
MFQLVLLSLDECFPLDALLADNLSQYLGYFFGAEICIRTVPDTEAPPRPGWESLRDRLNLPLTSRPARLGRGGNIGPHQLFLPELMCCLETAMQTPQAEHGIELEGAEVVLAITSNELFSSSTGLIPDEPAPEERTRTSFIRSRRHFLGVCTLAHLAERGSLPKLRRYFRQLAKFVTRCVLELFGLKACQFQSCLAYLKNLDLDAIAILLCAQCECNLINRTLGTDDYSAAAKAAVDRYEKLEAFFRSSSTWLGQPKIGYRTYNEFEEECEWLHLAVEVLRQCTDERVTFMDGGSKKVWRRSLLNSLTQVHARLHPKVVCTRTFSEPLIRRKCAVDMSSSAPFRHESGDLDKWTQAVHNRRHNSGGLYVELGGSLRGKHIANFVDAGLNASLILRTGRKDNCDTDDGSTAKPSEVVESEFPTRRRNATSLSYTTRKPFPASPKATPG